MDHATAQIGVPVTPLVANEPSGPEPRRRLVEARPLPAVGRGHQAERRRRVLRTGRVVA